MIASSSLASVNFMISCKALFLEKKMHHPDSIPSCVERRTPHQNSLAESTPRNFDELIPSEPE